MKTVLIIGADFAPSSLPPATRIRFFANHLAEFGWEPIVLTTKPEYYDWPIDPENEQLLSESLKVIRADAWRSSWTRMIGIGDIGIRSLWHHWQAINLLCRQRKIDLVFIPVPPSVSMVLGRMAYKRFGIPYVIDYIDPWVTDAYKNRPRNQRPSKWIFADALSRVLEPYALKYVAHITGVSKGTTDNVVRRYEWLSAEDATEIPYGAEADDFEYLRRSPRKNSIFERGDGLVHMSYVGACIPAMHTTVRVLFQAFRLGLERAPEKFARLRLHFIGTSYAPNGNGPQNVAALAREEGIGSYVDEQPNRIPYLESLQVMLDSDALFLVGSDEPHYTASKVFPCLLARRPLLAIFHQESSVVRILREMTAGRVVAFGPAEPPSAEQVLKELEAIVLYSQPYEAGDSPTVLEAYTTRAMSARLATSFEDVLAKHHRPRATLSPVTVCK